MSGKAPQLYQELQRQLQVRARLPWFLYVRTQVWCSRQQIAGRLHNVSSACTADPRCPPAAACRWLPACPGGLLCPTASLLRSFHPPAGGERGRLPSCLRGPCRGGQQAGVTRASRHACGLPDVLRHWAVSMWHPCPAPRVTGAAAQAELWPGIACQGRHHNPQSCDVPLPSSLPLSPPHLQQKPLISDFWYDVAGWVCLVGIVFGVAALSRTNAASGPAAA